VSRWPEKKLKFVAGAPIVNGVGEAADFDDGSWPRYIRITDIATPRSLRVDTFRSLPPLLARHADVQKGDLLLAAVGATFGKGYLHCDHTRACYAGYLVRVRPGRDMDPSFLAYWSESQHYWDQTRSRVVQATIQNFSAGKYRQLTVPCPPLSIQRNVAAFLDRKVTAINELIEKKERLIELLQQKRQALITQAVTKGLDPNVPMKDSGVEWLGTIPSAWSVTCLKRTCRIQPGYAFKSETFSSTGTPLVRMSNLKRGHLDLEDAVRIPDDLCHRAYALQEGDLLLGLSGSIGATGSLGNYAVVTGADLPLQLNQRVARFVAGPTVTTGFLRYFVESPAFTEPLVLSSTGTAQFNISPEQVGAVAIALPPRADQAAIEASVGRDLEGLDRLGELARRQAALLVEYRQALISAAVTGQLDLAEEAA
jgi:type I restriction enzyme S subunit